MRIAFIILAHEPAATVLRLARTLLDADPECQVVIHYDRKSSEAEFHSLQEFATATPRLHVLPDRVRCAWGEFGLVDGVVRAMRYIRDRQLPCDREMLISSSCWPVRPLAQLKRFLADRHGVEFIQCEDESWMQDGLRQERHLYWHWFNFQTQRRLFEVSVRVQRLLRIRRQFPSGLVPRFGSQWWCLTQTTCDAILDYIDSNPDAYRFFRTVWIPDEMAIQSLVYHLVPNSMIAGYTLTWFEFSNRGKPIIFYDDHIDFLQGLDCFFARKISPEATKLKERLALAAAGPDDGRPLESGAVRHRAFAAELHRRSLQARPGQIFWRDQVSDGSPGAMARSQRFAVALYGPAGILRQASTLLRGSPGLEVLGRIFHPACVDFGENRSNFAGLRRDDAAIRDLDPLLYLARILDRTADLPVFELSPMDDPRTTSALLNSENVVFVSFIPDFASDEAERLFLALSIAGAASEEAQRLGGDADVLPCERHLHTRRSIDSLIGRVLDARDLEAVRDLIRREDARKDLERPMLQRQPGARLLRCTFGACEASATQTNDSHQERRVLQATGGHAAPFLRALPRLDGVLRKLPPQTVLAPLPPAWQEYFMAIMTASAASRPSDLLQPSAS